MKRKKFLKFVLVITGIGLVLKGASKVYFNAFGGPVTAPQDNEGHWRSVKGTFGWKTARDLDTQEIIEQRRKDVTQPT